MLCCGGVRVAVMCDAELVCVFSEFVFNNSSKLLEAPNKSHQNVPNYSVYKLGSINYLF